MAVFQVFDIAQQNIFNVSSSEITEVNKIFIQHSDKGNVSNPFFLLNFQKGFMMTEIYKMSFGTQTGMSLPVTSTEIQFPNFSYFTNAVDLDQWGKYYFGGFYSNHAYIGAGNSLGLMGGN